jgi:hypothetical protein
MCRGWQLTATTAEESPTTYREEAYCKVKDRNVTARECIRRCLYCPRLQQHYDLDRAWKRCTVESQKVELQEVP